jgi:glycosyltransferase involved in cell wall biosynthesis
VDLSVVIGTYSLERWPDLTEAVGSLRRQTVRPAQIVVVADHNDEILARARTELADVIAIPNLNARGASGARNAGLAVATGNIVAFLDDDAAAEPEWVSRLLKHYSRPEVLGVGGALVPRWDAGRRPRWFPEEFEWVVGCSYRGLPEQVAPVRNLIGANMSYRRHVLESVGGFREGIGRVGKTPLGCEETELSIRVLQRYPRGQVLYDPGIWVTHRVPRSRGRPRYFVARCYKEGLSKALVSRSVGAASGLSSEWTYTLGVLPRGTLAGIRAGLHGDIGGFGRAAAIAVGLMTTTGGYVIGVARWRRGC